ncbi:MAG: thioredoxin-dependent thiol peroxidase [Terriglobales bacterium]
MASNVKMTTRRALRYNVDREGEAFMSIPAANTPVIDVNDKAPEFTLPDQNGKEVSLKDFRDKYVVLYFYPRADTPGCTIEACEFRDSYTKSKKAGTVVLGISPDQPKALKKFEEKFDLPFTLLGDAGKAVCNKYGVIQEKNMYGKKVMGVARTTFIIGLDGKVKHVFRKVKPEGHAEEVLAYLKEAGKGAA